MPEKDREGISSDINQTYDEVLDLISQEKKGTLKATRGMTTQETLEAYIVNNLGKLRICTRVLLFLVCSRRNDIIHLAAEYWRTS